GPYRTGTTWLYEYFRRHPEVSVPTKVKETFFFDMKYNKGFKWYSSHFKENKKHKIRGEIAPSYFRSTEAAKRLLKMNPDIKVFFTLRDPVDRIISQYKHRVMKGKTSFKKSIIELYNENSAFRYATQYSIFISKWREIIPPENLYILKFENFINDNQKYVNKICELLNIEKYNIPTKIKGKRGSSSIDPKLLFISRMGYKFINLARKLKLNFFIKLLKNIKIKSLLTTPNNNLDISNKNKKMLRNKLDKQIDFFKSLNTD
ncbi:MAG: sulfotransferase, partial [Candidatus Mcinerneyibacterium aminivorans]